jgi:hypothetical protein
VSPYAIPEETVLNLVNAAKAFKRAKTEERREYWGKRLIQRVMAYEQAEAENKARLKDKEAFERAATDRNWIDKDGKLTPYTELDQRHIENILTFIESRWDRPQHHPHWDGLLAELRRRVPTFVAEIP